MLRWGLERECSLWGVPLYRAGFRARAEPFRLCVVRPGWQTVNVDFFSNKKNSTSLPAFSVRVFLSKTCLGAICDDRGAHCHEIVHANGTAARRRGAFAEFAPRVRNYPVRSHFLPAAFNISHCPACNNAHPVLPRYVRGSAVDRFFSQNSLRQSRCGEKKRRRLELSIFASKFFSTTKDQSTTTTTRRLTCNTLVNGCVTTPCVKNVRRF